MSSAKGKMPQMHSQARRTPAKKVPGRAARFFPSGKLTKTNYEKIYILLQRIIIVGGRRHVAAKRITGRHSASAGISSLCPSTC